MFECQKEKKARQTEFCLIHWGASSPPTHLSFHLPEDGWNPRGRELPRTEPGRGGACVEGGPAVSEGGSWSPDNSLPAFISSVEMSTP